MLAVKDIAWLAGLLEGEGSFSTRKDNHIGIQLQMTDEDVVRKAGAMLGAKVLGPYTSKQLRKDGSPRKPVWGLRLGGAPAAGWMMTLYTFMGKRRRERIEKSLEQWKAIKRSFKGRKAVCHPDRKMQGRELCKACYQIWYRSEKRKDLDAHLVA